jgi:hypothetical protein
LPAADQEVSQASLRQSQGTSHFTIGGPGGVQGLQQLEGAAKRIVRGFQSSQLAVDLAHSLEGATVLQLYGRITCGLASESLVVSQSLLEEFFLQGIKPVFKPVLGNLGVHVIDGLASLLALQFRLVALAGDQHRAHAEREHGGDEEAGRGCHGGAVLSRPTQGLARERIGTGSNRLVGQIALDILGQFSRRGITFFLAL